MTDFIGTAGDDDYAGTGDSDTFDMTQGGKDTVLAGAGSDVITMGAALTAGDRIDGGADFDVLSIQGDYSAGLTLGPNTLHGIERIQFLEGFDYRLTLVDGNIDPGTRVDLSNDHGANSIWVDASAIVNGGSVYTYSQQPNTIIGTQSADDFFELTNQFNLDGQGGDDHATAWNAFSPDSRFDGGEGNDTFEVDFGFVGTLKGSTLRHVERVNLNFSCDITFANGNVDRGATMTVNASGASFIDASAETSGHYVINGSAGDDILIGGGGADTLAGWGGADELIGGAGADLLTGGDGVDNFVFELTTDSTKRAHDLITDFGVGTDQIDLSEIDARTDKAGDQPFRLVDHFTHEAGQLILTYDVEGDVTHVKGDVDGDGKVDLWIDVTGQLTDTTGFLL